MSAIAVGRCKAIRDHYYPEPRWPGTILRQQVRRSADEQQTLLEVGCGRDAVELRRLAGHFRSAIGVDLEVAAEPKPDDNWRLLHGDAHRLPLPDESVDTVVMRNVVEHLADPPAAFAECRRVMRPGGTLHVSTVNQRFPPILLARLLPHRLRQRLNRIATGTAEEDTFPAMYRANTAGTLRRAGKRAGLRVRDLRFVSAHPQYFMFSPAAYRAAIVAERLIDRSHWLRHIRHFIHVVFEKLLR